VKLLGSKFHLFAADTQSGSPGRLAINLGGSIAGAVWGGKWLKGESKGFWGFTKACIGGVVGFVVGSLAMLGILAGVDKARGVTPPKSEAARDQLRLMEQLVPDWIDPNWRDREGTS
jgi:hypothetical protein